jgi:CelD/BcsL family acetyltransferase involved in cellulose biosynthesis
MEKCGPVTMRFATQPDEIRAAVNALIRFKAAWSQSRGVETAYLVDGIEDYFQDLALAAARDHTLHLTTLEAGSDVLAAHLGFVSRDGLYYYVSSYDAAKAKWSPGRVHMTMLIMWSIEHGLRRFDFLRGDADYKNRLATSSRQLEDIVFPRGLIGRIVVQGFLQRQRRPGHQPAGAIRASALPIGLGGADA